ncbi:MAG: glycosyltransferase 87 family protein [Candidatus Tyrphobacter sp.]
MSARSHRLTVAARAAAAVAVFAFSFGVTAATVAHGRFAMGDFKAFYCSARVVLEREDPYAAAPMVRCQSTPAPAPLLVTKPGQVLPAPLPGYAIAAFVPLALLPFPVACVLWIIVLLAATVAAIVLLARAGIGKPWTIAVALSILVGAAALTVGEIPPIALFGLALAICGARENRAWKMGVGVALTLAEPQIGTAVALAAIAVNRRNVAPVALAALALGTLSLATLGLHENLEYVSVVLPAHLVSELPSVLQYGLSWALYQSGTSAHAAVEFGRLSWVLMLGAAIWFARSAPARRSPEVALLAAPAFAIVGGPFLHFDHMALAMPAAVWFAAKSSVPRWLRIAAVTALAIPLLHVFSHVPEFVLVPIVACWLGAEFGGSFDAGLRSALVAVAVAGVVVVVSLVGGSGAHPVAAPHIATAALAQDPWAQYVAGHLAMTSWTIWFVKAPTWFAIVTVAAGFAAAAISSLLEAVRHGRLAVRVVPVVADSRKV